MANASRVPETNRQGDVEVGEVCGAPLVGPARGVERVGDEDETGSGQAGGDGHGAHAATHRASPEHQPLGGDAERSRQRLGFLDHRRHQDRRPVGRPPPWTLAAVGEVEADGGHRGDRRLDGDETGLVPVAAGARCQQQPGNGHRAGVEAGDRVGGEDASGLGQLPDAVACPLGAGTVVGVGFSQELAEAPLHLAPVGGVGPREPEDRQRPQLGVGEGPCRPRACPDRPRQVGDHRGAHRSLPAHGPAQHLHHRSAHGEVEPAGDVDGTEDLRRRRALVVELEVERVAPAHEAVTAAGQADVVDLEPVAEPGLGDAPARFQVGDEAAQLGEQVGVEVPDVGGHDAPEQEPAEPGRRIGGERRAAERHPPRRCDGPAVPDLELGQQHRATVPAPSGQPVGGKGSSDHSAQTRGRTRPRKLTAAAWTSSGSASASRRAARPVAPSRTADQVRPSTP